MDGEINIKILQLLQLESVRMVQKIGMQGNDLADYYGMIIVIK
jgi:hypothetical protein